MDNLHNYNSYNMVAFRAIFQRSDFYRYLDHSLFYCQQPLKV
jgi:hypothetical protein